MNWLNLLGFILMTIGSFIVFLLNYNANELDKARFIKWEKQAKNDGSLNFKIRWSKLGKQIFLAYFIIFVGFILQLLGYLYDYFLNS